MRKNQECAWVGSVLCAKALVVDGVDPVVESVGVIETVH
jgi:hypothetical protein